jgi:predicted nucleotidyltransferase
MSFNQVQFDKIASLAKVYGATKLVLFGSAQESPDSARDIDLACDGIAGWKLYELAARLEDELNVPLDLVPLTPPTRFTRMIERNGRRLL